MEVPGGLMVIAPETGDYQFIPYASIDKLRWKVKHCHMGCPAIVVGEVLQCGIADSSLFSSGSTAPPSPR